MELIVTVFLGIISAACLLYGWYFIQQTRLKERILLAEKGMDLNTLVPKKKDKNLWLKIGIVVTSASSGLFFSLIIASFHIIPIQNSDPLIIIFLFLFGGIGMVIAHYVDKPKDQN